VESESPTVPAGPGESGPGNSDKRWLPPPELVTVPANSNVGRSRRRPGISIMIMMPGPGPVPVTVSD
jgi:hypothetical protein